MSYFRDNSHFWSVWHKVLKGSRSKFRLSKFATPEDFFGQWRAALEARVQEATERLASLNGVTGLILGGGIGKGVPWPLSDVDVIGIFRQDRFEAVKQQVRETRSEVEERWAQEGFVSYLDIRGIVFTDGEANRLLATERLDVGQLLDDQRWFHGLDKAANGRVLYDSDGSTGSLLARITKLRWSDPVVAERKVRRQNRVPQPSLADLETVRRKIIDGTTTEGNLAFRNLVGGLVWSLFSVRWDDSGKLGRNCTRFEVEAARRGLGEPARKLIRLVESPADSPARLRLAPNRVVDQHRLSYPANK